MIELLIAAPLCGLVLIGIIPKWAKEWALVSSLFSLLLILFTGTSFIGEELNYLWITSPSIHFHLGIDRLSLFFLLLTALIIPSIIQSTSKSEKASVYAILIASEAILFILFMAKDLFLFFLFWEAMILPAFFGIYFFGGERKKEAAFTFLLYMMAGSCLMMLAVIALYITRGTFSIPILTERGGQEFFPFIIFLLAIAVKAPLFPFHGWLRLAYVEAPFWATILMAALLSKGAAYALLRIGMGFFPELIARHATPLMIAAAFGMIYGALLAFNEKNYKGMLAYSSFSHMNFLLGALFVSGTALIGGLLQAMNHAVVITALFILIEALALKTGSFAIQKGAGILRASPILGWITLAFILAAVALPGTGNFMGEILVLMGLFSTHPKIATLLATTLIFSLAYMVRFIKISLQGTPQYELNEGDLSSQDRWSLAIPGFLVFAIGIYPAPWIQFLKEIK